MDEEDMLMNESFDHALANLEIPSEPKRMKPGESSEQSAAATGQSTSKYSPNVILVNSRQRGNPVLKSIVNVKWEFDEIVPDYIVGKSTCILYLSLKYHNYKPDYIHEKLKELGKSFELRILLVQVDMKDPHSALKNLTRICILANLTLMLAWNAEEAGKIIETYKLYENRPPDLIMEKADQYPHQKLITAITNIKPVNKTDAITLLQEFGNLSNIINSSEERLSLCSGLGPRKANRLHKIFNEPFMKP